MLQTTFGSEGSGNGQFKSPAGVAVNEATGDVYVVDQEEEGGVDKGRVEWFTSNTTTQEYEYAGQFNGSGELPNETVRRRAPARNPTKR